LDKGHYPPNHDHVNSHGEVVAVSSSASLGVETGDSLLDPKLRLQYLHPSLQRWKVRRTSKGRIVARDLDQD
jgi:hypothetical protein